MRPQPLVIRITHWVNVPVLVVMAMSGLQILHAYPYFGPQGEQWTWVPFQGLVTPEWMRAGGWLAGARHVHFLFAWLFVINAIVYAVYVVWKRAYWRPLYKRRQRVAYAGALALALLEVLSGFAIWKPVQLSWLAALFGGYDGARVVHWLALLALAVFVIAHIIMVAIHPKTFMPMITGGPRETP